MAPLVLLKPVQCIFTVTLWCMNLHYKFFGIGIPLLCLSVSRFLFLSLPHVMVCELFVVIGMQLQLHEYHRRFKVPASWTPVFRCRRMPASRCRAATVYWFHGTSTTLSRFPSPNSRRVVLSPDPLWPLQSSRGESTMHCLQTFLYMSALNCPTA